MKHTILALWSLLAGRSQSLEARLNEAVIRLDDASLLLGAIDALAERRYSVAARMFREFADQLEDDEPNESEWRYSVARYEKSPDSRDQND